MKHTKCMISILLSLLLALLLLVPAAAEEVAEDVVMEAAVDAAEDAVVDIAAGDPSYAPIIVTQPRATAAARVGKTLKLSVEAQLPAAGGELSYAWYDYYGGAAPISTSAELVLPVTKDMLKKTPFPPENFSPFLKSLFTPATEMIGSGNQYFYVVVTNTYTHGDGMEQSVSVKSDYSHCYVYQSYFSAIGSISPLIFKYTSVFAVVQIPVFAILYALILHPIVLLNAMRMNRG